MIIKLVSRSCVDNMQYFDAIVYSNGRELFLTNVLYNVRVHVWSVKFPNSPLFETISFGDVINFLAAYLRDVFYR